MKSHILSTLTNPIYAFTFFAGISALALIMAFISQYVFGLAPCVLCIYQRYPYALIIALGILGAWVVGKKPFAAPWIMGAISLSFIINSAIAFYHTGVERKWWPSHLEGCAVPEMKGDITDVLAQIAATPVVRCDEIPWTDPIIGLSMANYNVMLCLGLGILAAVVTWTMRQTSSQSPARP